MRGLASTKASHSAGTGRPAAQLDLARGEPELLDGAAQPAETVLLHLHHARTLAVMAVALRPFEVGVELEIVDVVFAVPGGEADQRLVAALCAQDAERDLAVLGGEHLDAIGARPDDRGVVEPHAELPGAGRIAVDVDGLDGKLRVEAPSSSSMVTAERPAGLSFW